MAWPTLPVTGWASPRDVRGVQVQLCYPHHPGQPFTRDVTVMGIPGAGDMVAVDHEVVAVVGAIWWTPLEQSDPGMPPVVVSLREHVDITPDRLAAAGWHRRPADWGSSGG